MAKLVGLGGLVYKEGWAKLIGTSRKICTDGSGSSYCDRYLGSNPAIL